MSERTTLGGITVSSCIAQKLELLSAMEKKPKSYTIELALTEYFERNPDKVYTVSRNS